MRLVVLMAVFVATHAQAAQPRLTSCLYSAFTPSESTPFDLDWCKSLADGDDISLLLDDIAAAWPGSFYVRAPSRTLTVLASYRAWTATGAKTFMFLEDESALNALTIKHIPVSTACTGAACFAYWRLWAFADFQKVKLGGPNLMLTFIGNHPGFANCTAHAYYATQVGIASSQIPNCDINQGLIHFDVGDNSPFAILADVRANIRYAQMYALMFSGGPWYYEQNSNGHIQTCNVAGVMYATSGIFSHDGGCRDIWLDPERTVVTDPYVRMSGWQGQVVAGTVEGLPMACADGNQDQLRGGAIAAYYSSKMTGGVTLQYGNYGFVQRYSQRVGNGVKDPFIVRLQDVGVTGPVERPCPTGFTCAPGSRPRLFGDVNYFKGDPHHSPDTGGFLRFMRIHTLTPRYGLGLTVKGRAGCADSANSSDGGGDEGNWLRFENGGVSFPTRDWMVELAGDWRLVSQGGKWNRTLDNLIAFGSYEDSGQSYRNGMRLADGAQVLDKFVMRDTTTITGPGTYNNLETGQGYGTATCRNNTVTNTNVNGVITATCGTLTVSNVKFNGAARAVITVSAGASVVASALCVPAGSTIAGAGTLTYDGAAKTLPYTVTPATGCNTTAIADPAPGQVTGGTVN